MALMSLHICAVSSEPLLLARPKIRPKNGFFCYVPFLGLIFWVTFCSNSNTLTFDSKVSIWNKSLVKNLL